MPMNRTPTSDSFSKNHKSETDLTNMASSSEFVNKNNNNSRSKQAARSSQKRVRPNSSPEQAISSPDCNLEQQQALSQLGLDQEYSISQALAQQTAMIASLVADVSEIKKQNTQIQKSNSDIERAMNFINQQFEDLKKEIDMLKKENRDQSLYIQQLENKIQDINYKSRSSGIEIRNVPQKEGENTVDLTMMVCSIGEAVGEPINQADIRDIYRLPGKPDTQRPIVAEFVKVQTKDNILVAVRKHNQKSKSTADKLNSTTIGIPGTVRSIYVSEQLPGSTKKLFRLAREFANANSYKYCWIKYGNIFIRKNDGDKHIIIKSNQCLHNLLTKQ